MTFVCHEFYDLIIRIFQRWLINVSALKGFVFVVQCFESPLGYLSPFLFGQSLGMGSFRHVEREPSILSSAGGVDRLSKLRGLYTHFRPLTNAEGTRIWRHNLGGWSTDPANCPVSAQAEYMRRCDRLKTYRQIFPCERCGFSCDVADMVRRSTKGWLVLSRVDTGKDATSIWQDEVQKPWDLHKSNASDSGFNIENTDEKFRQWIRWADRKQSAGFLIQVADGKDAPSPLQVRMNDSPDATPYCIEYDGELKFNNVKDITNQAEFVIRTTKLLLIVEAAMETQSNHHESTITVW